MKNSKRLIVGVMLVCLMLLLAGCGSNEGTSSSTGSKSSDGSSESSSDTSSASGLGKNIKSEAVVTNRGKLVVLVNNNNNEYVDMDIEVEFYDKDGNFVGSGKESLYGVNKKSEVALGIYDTPESWDNYKIYVDATKTEDKVYYDKIEVTDNNNGEEIVAQIKNNSDDTIDSIHVSILYYQGDTVVGYGEDSEYDVKAGRSANFSFYYPFDNDYKDISFDSYKIFVNEASSYK